MSYLNKEEVLQEALIRIGEMQGIINSDLLSGKAKMRALTQLVLGYYAIDYAEVGEIGQSSHTVFGESRTNVSLQGLVPKKEPFVLVAQGYGKQLGCL